MILSPPQTPCRSVSWFLPLPISFLAASLSLCPPPQSLPLLFFPTPLTSWCSCLQYCNHSCAGPRPQHGGCLHFQAPQCTSSSSSLYRHLRPLNKFRHQQRPRSCRWSGACRRHAIGWQHGTTRHCWFQQYCQSWPSPTWQGSHWAPRSHQGQGDL